LVLRAMKARSVVLKQQRDAHLRVPHVNLRCRLEAGAAK
jgi:hypothetical protein